MSINVNGFQIHSDQVQGEFKWFKVWPEIIFSIYSAPDAAREAQCGLTLSFL